MSKTSKIGNLEFKKAWIEALRSGKYKQTRYLLKGENGYCCLGVACEVYNEMTGSNVFKYLKEKYQTLGLSALPLELFKFAEVVDFQEYPENKTLENCGRFIRGNDSRLDILNDNGSTFEEIADIIEKEM